MRMQAMLNSNWAALDSSLLQNIFECVPGSDRLEDNRRLPPLHAVCTQWKPAASAHRALSNASLLLKRTLQNTSNCFRVLAEANPSVRQSYERGPEKPASQLQQAGVFVFGRMHLLEFWPC